MKIQILFKNETKKISSHYNMLFLSLIKKSLEIANFEYFKRTFLSNTKKMKPFTYGVYLKDFVLKNDEFICENGSLNLSIIDYEFFMHFYNGISQLKEFRYKNYVLKIEKIILRQEKEAIKNSILIKTLSPIYIKDKSGQGLLLDNEKYEEELNYISNLILNNFKNRDLKQRIKIYETSKTKKVVIKEDITDVSPNMKNKYLYLTCLQGYFVLKGHIDDLNVLLKTGIGFKRSQGFGFIDLEGQL